MTWLYELAGFGSERIGAIQCAAVSESQEFRSVFDAAFGVLKGQYRMMLLSGVRVGLSDYEELTPIEKQAAARAGYELRCEFLYKQALASKGPIEAAELFAEIDGGEELESAVLDVAFRELQKARAGHAKAKQ